MVDHETLEKKEKLAVAEKIEQHLSRNVGLNVMKIKYSLELHNHL